jgi:hypothetical protein
VAGDGPDDSDWEYRDSQSARAGQNPVGLALMRVRDEPIAELLSQLATPGAGR